MMALKIKIPRRLEILFIYSQKYLVRYVMNLHMPVYIDKLGQVRNIRL